MKIPKLTRSQTCWGIALAIGLAALAIDQYAGTAGPAAAEASATATAGEADAAPALRAHAPPNPAAIAFDSELAARLNRLGTGSPRIRDGFRPSSRWVIGPGAALTATSEQALAFQQAHSLKAVTLGGGQAYALVDSSLVAVGQTYDGFLLVSAGQMRATFRCGDTIAELVIAR